MSGRDDSIPAPPIERRALVRDSIRITSLLGAGICAVFAIFGDPDVAIAVAIGTLLGVLNFVLLARGVGGAIDRTVAGVDRARQELGVAGSSPDRANSGSESGSEGLEPADVLGRPLGAGGGLRIALSVLLIAALILVLPVDPAGLATGIVITLIGASLAGYRHNRARGR